MDNNDRLYEIALSMVPKLGYKSQRALYGLYASAKEIYDLPAKELYAMFGPSRSDIASAIIHKTTLQRAETELQFLEKKQAKVLFMTDKDYPQRMNHCDDTPPLLYYRGQANLNATRVIGMVGTRKATAYGVEAAGKIVEGLVGDDTLIVSGLALGIDAASHRAACEAGIPTVGVVAHGFDRFYPPANKELARNMVNGDGGMITQFVSQTAISPSLFPVRNAVIAAMSDCVIVVEAGAKGGALITANIANSYNRQVLAVPGRVGDKYSNGCNKLIAYNQAAMVTDADEVYYQMGWDRPKDVVSHKKVRPMKILSPEETRIYTLLQQYPDGLLVEEIVLQSDFSIPKIATLLMQMELDGVIKCLPGKVYKIV